MDENTNMMIQLASMMMQNQTAIQETQSQLEAATKSHTPPSNADDITTFSPSLPPVSSAAGFGMDPKLMAEFARHIMTNANKGGVDALPMLNKKSSPKSTTIAQIMKTQEGLTPTASSEGKIFVYNKMPNPDENMSPTDTETVGLSIKSEPNVTATPFSTLPNGVYPLPNKGSSSVGPVRNRYGRVLRPGIDNYGQFEQVASHGLIMHAMELLRQKDKKKRGPKEKDTFSVFMYCLPDKNSKLPKFSSLDPIERALVDQHQKEGYGYPEIDYINGIPRKTQLCLSFDESRFHSYMISLYPKLDGRLYDMYRIDKTRRLIRVEANSPRQLKDMKYQGSLIVIPYEQSDERPAPIIHRNFDDVYSGSGSNSQSFSSPLSLIKNLNIQLPSLSMNTSPEASLTSKPSFESLPVYPDIPILTKIKSEDSNEGMETEHQQSKSDNRDNENTFDDVKLLARAAEARARLLLKQTIKVRQDYIFHDIIAAYREDETLEHCKLRVDPTNDTRTQEHVQLGPILCMFWEEAFKKYFTGSHHLVPMLDSFFGEDLFQILGRVLVHGIILENYVPLNLSPACLSFILANTCSDQLSLSSFYQIMSNTEREVLLAALAEGKHGVENFSPRVERSIKTVLGSYGCKTLPAPFALDGSIPNIARSFLLHKPYWALCQIQESFCQSELDISGITEDDIMQVYKVLSFDVPSILERTIYLHSSDKDLQATETNVKEKFEAYLHKLPNVSVQKLLQQWCGFNCLCVKRLYVTFASDNDDVLKMFNPREATLTLPSACMSVEELSQLVTSQMSQKSKNDAANAWEYIL